MTVLEAEPSTKHDWTIEHSHKQLERRRSSVDVSLSFQPHNLTSLFIGLAAQTTEDAQLEIGFVVHDGTYSIDFAVKTVPQPSVDAQSPHDGVEEDWSPKTSLEEQVVSELRAFERKHDYKFLGAGLNQFLVDTCPGLPSLLWAELDVVPFVFSGDSHRADGPRVKTTDELADLMARFCIGYFGPAGQPRVVVGHKGEVLVDANGRSPISSLEQYKTSVSATTWDAVTHYAQSVSQRKIKIAFFSATPQGGGVALMRHALVRFFRTMDVDCKWYVPRPRPEVFRITKTNHNILQGVADPEERLTKAQQQILDEWVQTNVDQKWGKPGGPLASREDGGADFIVVDDPQMPSLVSIAKKIDPGRPVVFRSHIQVRADLADTEGTPTAEVWNWAWERVKQADVFVSHPVKAFVPSNVTFDKVAWLPATTDWLDGLNKNLSTYDSQHYIHDFNTTCFQQQMQPLAYPARDYIAQIARFDPSKGIPDVLASYAILRRKYLKDHPKTSTPQLVIAGHGSVDDPDASRIFDHTLHLLDTKYQDIASDVILQRVGPTDQLLNAVQRHAKVALQLSTREGFEVKVSEALHKGVPVIATRAGGIPLQVRNGEGGYLVEVGDSEAVARHLFDLFSDRDLYRRMSRDAKRSVGDEVGTVGNALAWLYLADTLTKGEKVVPRGGWVNDMAREKCDVPYQKGENRLPRDLSTRAR